MSTHLHHVIPKSRGGSDDPSNLIEIDFIEHARLHAEDFLNGGPRFDFRHPGWPLLESSLREAVLKRAAEDTREKNLQREIPCATGCKHSEESRKLRSERVKGENNPMFGTDNARFIGFVFWVNTETGELTKSKNCPGPLWKRGRKL
jgi:hypothetical protein